MFSNPTIYRPPATKKFDMTNEPHQDEDPDTVTMIEDIHTIIMMKETPRKRIA